MNPTYPRARTQGLIVRDLADEIVVYDPAREKALCLNPTAALVWKHADGHRTPADIARLISEESGAQIDEQVVWQALGQLHRDSLLDEAVESTSALKAVISNERVSRGKMMKLVGAAVAVPVVASIAASPAYAAFSCGHTCGASSECPQQTGSPCPSCAKPTGSQIKVCKA